MGLFKILKSVIGLGSSGSRSTSGTAEPGRENVDVTVEHEPDTTSEDAVKGTGDEPTADADAASTPAATPDTAGESDDESVSEDATEPEIDADGTETEAAEPEATEPAAETEDADPGGAEAEDTGVETDDEAEPDATGTGGGDADEPAVEVENADAATDTIKGIGSSYAETLADAGVETVGDLAAADAADIAGQTDISEKRVGRWIARARGEDE